MNSAVPRFLLVSAVVCALNDVIFSSDETFNEELFLKRLPSKHFLANFRFSTTKKSPLGNHYDLFPKMIGELIQIYELSELHLSLTQGFWRHNSWGYQPQPATPVGAQVWVWFQHNSTDLDTKWKNLIHALSGLFCASLSQLDPTLTVSPELSFRPRGVVPEQGFHKTYLRYGVLPSENVCTENLTPWKKLIPCIERGLSSLLNPLQLYGSHFHSLTVDARRICLREASCEKPAWELTQNMVSVFDAPLRRKNLNWNLVEFFGPTLDRSCSLAEFSNIFVDISTSRPVFTPEHTEIVTGESGGLTFSRFDLKKLMVNASTHFNIRAVYEEDFKFSFVPPCHLSVHSYLGGTGLQNGKLVTRLTNQNSRKERIVFMQIIPWFLRTYYHTLDIRCDWSSNENSGGSKRLEPLFRHFTPGKDRQRPYVLEMGLEILGKTNCFVEIEFEKSLLRWTEYPPDAHRGFFVPATVISFSSSNLENLTLPFGRSSTILESLRDSSGGPWFVQIFSEVLLVNLPTPDFSMPYNVICLVCTVMALAFGPLHNMTSRSLVLKSPEEIKKSSMKEKVKTLVQKVLGRILKSKRRKQKEINTNKAENDAKEIPNEDSEERIASAE